MLTAAVALLLLAVEAASGNGSVKAAAFLQVADAISPCPLGDQERFRSSSLPRTVSDHLWQDYYQAYGEERLPDSIRGFALDLNQDGSREYFLETPLGGSGGTHYVVLSRLDGDWREILNFQGWFCLLPAADGWHPIVAMSRGGWEIYYKARFHFSGRRYRQVWGALFDRGKVTEVTSDAPRPTVVQEPDCSAPVHGASFDERFCASQAYEDADKALNQVYDRAIEKIRNASLLDGKQRREWEEMLGEAHRAWIEFKERDCEVVDYEGRGSTGMGVTILHCLAIVTRERDDELRKRFGLD